MSEKKPCPVEKVEGGLEQDEFEDQVVSACAECPNRAPSQAEAEMREALEGLLAEVYPFDEMGLPILAHRNAEAILAKYPKGGST